MQKYYEDNIDELIFVDTVATLYGRNQLQNIIFEASKEILYLLLSEGIRSIRDAENSFMAGADKILINSQAVKNPNFIYDLSKDLESKYCYKH